MMSNNEFEPRPPQSGDQFRADVPAQSGWERSLLEKLAFASLREQRARRRWGVFLKLLTLAIIVFGLWLTFDFGAVDIENVGQHTALVNVDGAIEADGKASAESIISALNKAYANTGSVGIIMRINSPGGSPVQASMVNDEMVRLRRAYPQKPLYVVVDDMCASGGYYIAVAADKIYVNKASIVGSIGVLMDGFGFTGLMDKLGVERRLLTAGENKGFLDPFSPQSAAQKDYALDMLKEIHQQFIEVVRKGRGDRLKETPDMFSGLFWTGTKAVEMGLADGFGSVDSVARDVLKVEDMVDYTQREGLPERVLKKFGAAVGSGAVKAISTANPVALH
jgi:protease-4